jgi:hypothetical protein
MGVIDAICEGEVPSWDDVAESADTVGRIANPVYGAYATGHDLGEDAAYMHYERRDELNHVGDPSMYPTTDELPTEEDSQNDNGWTLLNEDLSVLHQDDSPEHPQQEAKFVHEDGRESVKYRNEDGTYGDEVTRDDIRGTYNYVNPGNWEEDSLVEYGARMIGHGVVDVLPWMIGGSVRGPG